jgi:hypothetical protein
MATQMQTSTTTTAVDPTIQPYLTFGLSEARKQYEGGGPQFYPGQGYVGPSTATQTALQALQARAMAGNPLLAQAQGNVSGMLAGDYLGGNPFFQGAFQPAATAAQTAFQKSIGDISSAASKAGRYGSGAMGDLQSQAAGTFAQKLADTAGRLSYENYAQERQNQMRALGLAPGLAEADYGDINKLLGAGQLGEGYQTSALQADMARYNFEQNAPQKNLTNYLNMVYGFPAGRTSTQTTPYYTNPTATALGTGLLGLNVFNAANQASGGGLSRGVRSGWDYLTGGFNSPNDFSSGMSYMGQVRPDMTDYMGGGFYGYD